MTSVIQVMTTTAEKEHAQQIAQLLIERQLAACVQISGPLESLYWWEGKVQSDQEWLCVAKTLDRRYPDVEQAIRTAHPYDEPEILAVPVSHGSPGYLQWVEKLVAKSEG